MKSKVHLLVLVMSFVTCVSSAQLPQSLIVHEATLSNGLKVWLNEDHSQPVHRAGSGISPSLLLGNSVTQKLRPEVTWANADANS
ncbi:MAG: hypothetical protein IIZ88_02695, partial [Prevotella sp.]|nr:hypothetical protein [Prevotella sp.]